MNKRNAFTLIELAIVIAIVALIAAMAASRVSGIREKARQTAAQSDMAALREAIMDPASGYIHDMQGLAGFSPSCMRLGNLFISTNLYGLAEDGDRLKAVRIDAPHPEYMHISPIEEFVSWNDERQRGWRGPYLKHAQGAFPAGGDVRHEGDSTFASRGFYPDLQGLDLSDEFLSRHAGCSIYGFPGEPAAIDPWGNPYVLQIPPPQAWLGTTNIDAELRFSYARIVSAGSDGVLQTPCFDYNATNRFSTAWDREKRRASRQAGRVGSDCSSRGDDLVLFLLRSDIDEDYD